jgi:hypothetical protein
LRRIDDRWQTLAPGEHVPDWGLGDPTFEVVSIDAPHALVYRSIRPRKPRSGLARPDLVPFLDDLPDGRSRLRTNQIGQRFPRATETMAETIDRVTVALLFAGLRERVR